MAGSTPARLCLPFKEPIQIEESSMDNPAIGLATIIRDPQGELGATVLSILLVNLFELAQPRHV